MDAVGRHGVAVARLDETSGEREEWIFDRKTHVFLGERSVQVKENSGEGALIKPGTVTYTSAIMNRAIVDGIKQTPSQAGTATGRARAGPSRTTPTAGTFRARPPRCDGSAGRRRRVGRLLPVMDPAPAHRRVAAEGRAADDAQREEQPREGPARAGGRRPCPGSRLRLVRPASGKTRA